MSGRLDPHAKLLAACRRGNFRPAALNFSQVGDNMTPLGIRVPIAHQTMTLTIAADNELGLTSAEARARLNQFGPNAVAEEKAHPLKAFLKRFWAPIPWLLEASIIIQLCIGETVEAAVIGGLLVVNGVLSFLQEGRAQKALALLRQQLRVQACVRRDGQWITLPAEELVPGDVLHLRQGSIVPADVKITDGTLLVDQSALTGESAAVSVPAGSIAYAGGMVRGGEASGEITATVARTFFGKTAELVRTAGAVNRQEHEIVAVVRNLFVINAATVVIVLGYAHLHGLSIGYVLPLLLSILLASIPVALPATFTLAAALGSVELSRRGVLITRLSALHDIASMTVLCSDKTGTLTRNEATVNMLWPAPGFSENDLLRAAALASDPAGQDPVDDAVIKAANARGWHDGELTRLEFKPFDPATKLAEAVYRDPDSTIKIHFLKGAPAVIAKLSGAPETLWQSQAVAIMARGQRVLAVAQGNGEGSPSGRVAGLGRRSARGFQGSGRGHRHEPPCFPAHHHLHAEYADQENGNHGAAGDRISAGRRGAGRRAAGVFVGRFPVGPLPTRSGYETFAVVDILHHDSQFASRRVSVARAAALLAIAAQLFSGVEFVVGCGRHLDSVLRRPADAGDWRAVAARRGGCRAGLFHGIGLAKGVAVPQAGFALRRDGPHGRYFPVLYAGLCYWLKTDSGRVSIPASDGF